MASPAILWKFEFSVTTVFVIEVGDSYMRFFKLGAAVTDSAGIYELTTTYAEADLYSLQYKQINDVIYITHPDYPVRKLSRIADNSWTIEDVEFDTPCFLDENLTSTTITPSATSGAGVTLTASSGIFQSGHVGSYWRVGHVREGDSTQVDIDGNKNGSSVAIFGDWNVRSYGTWECDILVQRSTDAGSTWKTIRKFEGESDRNIDATGSADSDALYRLTIENYVSATSARVVLEWNEHTVYGVAKVTAYSSATSVTATITTTLADTSATEYWSEGAWSAVRGYPRALTIHEQRLVVGGTEYQPATIWGSASGDFENFLRGTNDSDSWAYSIAGLELNSIQWLVSQKELLVGTTGNEWAVSSQAGAGITGTDVNIRLQSNKGSAYQAALVVNDSVLFVGRKGRKIFDIQYTFESEKFLPQDLTLFAEHLTLSGVVQMAYQKEPIPILWCVTTDGALIGFTFDREQNVMGWHRHDTDGLFESVVAIYGATTEDDNVYVIVQRTIGSTTSRFIEVLDPTQWTAKEDYFGVDSGLSYTGSAATAFAGLDHLEGEDVDVLANGAVYQGLGVASGTVTLPSGSAGATVVHAGLPFTSEMQPFRLDADSIAGVHMGRKKRIGDLRIRLLKSVGFSYETGNGTTYNGEFDADVSTQDLYTGELPVDFATGWTDDPQLIIKQSYPLPLHVLALVAFYDIGGPS